MADSDWLAAAFEQHRDHLRAVAYRLLGSVTDADDAVQDTWLRLTGADICEVENLGGWLTTVVARVSLNMLRARRRRHEEPVGDSWPSAAEMAAGNGPPGARTAGRATDPEAEAVLADSVGLALLVVLDTLTPAERLAFVLHDTFGIPFTEVAGVLGRSTEATRQLASRARRRVRGTAPAHDGDPATQRAAVDAFLAASRDGDFDGLIAVLHPDVVYRADRGAAAGGSVEVRGAKTVAGQAMAFSQRGLLIRPVLINGMPGVISSRDGRPFSVIGFTVTDGKITEIDVIVDPDRLGKLDLSALGEQRQ